MATPEYVPPKPCNVPIDCKAHPLMNLKVNLIVGLLSVNLIAAWAVYEKEMKPILIQNADQEARLKSIEASNQLIVQSLNEHLNRPIQMPPPALRLR